MFWPFGKKPKADNVMAIMDEAIDLSKDEWLGFHATLKLKDGMSLEEEVQLFCTPMAERLSAEFPALKHLEGTQLVIVAKSIVKSGTHAREDVEEALNISIAQ